MDREEYNKCMKPWMTGAGKTKDERKTSFGLAGVVGAVAASAASTWIKRIA